MIPQPLRWVDHILRLEETGLIHRSIKHCYIYRQEGDLLSDAPETRSFGELVKYACDRQYWRLSARKLREPIRTTTEFYIFESTQELIPSCVGICLISV